MKYFVTIGGRKYDFLRLKFKRTADMESQVAELLLAPAKNTTLPTQDESVIINKEVNNTTLLKWQGKVQRVQHIPLPNNTVKVIAYDLKFKINFNNVISIAYASQKGSAIFSIEAQPTATTDLTLGTVQTTDAVLDTVTFGKSILAGDSKITRSSAFEILQILGDSDIYIERNGTAHYLRDAGTSRTTTHVLEHGLNGTLMPDIGYSEDEIRRVKQVIVKGAGVGSNFFQGSAGSPTAADKVKQIELPFALSDATADLAAQTILTELDKTNKYAKFQLEVDLFQTNYDVYDTVKLKARLPNKNVDENLKIFSIETIVSSGLDDISEISIIELQNFERAQLAKMLNPIEVSSNSLAMIKTGISFTQAGRNSIPTRIEEAVSVEYESQAESFELIGQLHTFNSTPIMGAYVTLGLNITTRKKALGAIQLYFFDGTDVYPDNSLGKQIQVFFNPNVGERTYDSLTYFIPADLAGKTLNFFINVDSFGEIDVTGKALIQSVSF